jgi:chemotaxis protein methyltransferase CheR
VPRLGRNAFWNFQETIKSIHMPNGVRGAALAFVSSEAASADSQREFTFSDADFRDLAQFAYNYAGIALTDSKRNLVYSRLSRRLRALGLSSFREYRDHLAANDSELEGFINAISTNLTKFFREAHHFDHFRTHVAAPFARANGTTVRRLRVWSAGCSTGEEAYTIAVVLKREIRDIKRHDVRILATDIDTDVLSKGIGGEYPISSIEEVPKVYREYFQPADGSRKSTTVAIGDEVRSLVTFRRLNLIEPWPFNGKFDAIFCRNVMIYFDGPTKSRLVERFTQQLTPGGWLFIGHSESLIGSHPGLQLVGRTIYRREA